MTEKEQSLNQSYEDLLYEFGQNTTIHSVSKQTSRYGGLRRCIWLILLLVSLGALIWQIYLLVNQYMAYPLGIKTISETQHSLEFPAITICNLNPLRRSKIASSYFMKEIESQSNSSTSLPHVELKRKLSKYINSLTPSEAKRLGHQQEDFIVNCSWNGEPCKQEFNQFFDGNHGNCFTFNSNEQNVSHIASSINDHSALELLLNVESSEYIGPLSQSLGIIVQIHDRDIMAFPDEKGLVIAPGFATNIAFRMRITERLSTPYNKRGCKPKDTPTLYKGKSYSVEACIGSCFINATLQPCGCVSAGFNMEPACDPFNTTQSSCLGKELDGFETSLRKCNCASPCNETDFLISTSSTLWPSESYWKYIKPNLQNSKALDVSSTLLSMRENIGKVKFYYQTFRVDVVQQFKTYEIENLISDIGGQLGLFVGMSVLSVCEVFELLFDLFVQFLNKRKDRVNAIST